MTRINCVPVETLHSKMLLAEYRELPRVFKLAHNAVQRGFKQDIHTYRMGAGHVKFFYDKLMYLSIRHEQLVNEMRKRGYTTNVTDVGVSWLDLECSNIWQDWQPAAEDMRINQKRIDLRLKEMNEKINNKLK